MTAVSKDDISLNQNQINMNMFRKLRSLSSGSLYAAVPTPKGNKAGKGESNKNKPLPPVRLIRLPTFKNNRLRNAGTRNSHLLLLEQWS